MRQRYNPMRMTRRKQKGSAMVEAALTLVAFVSLFLGAIDIAQILLIHQSILERVRLAARTAAVNCCNETAVRNVVLYGSPQSPTDQSATGYWGLSAGNVTVNFAGQNTPDQRVTIRVAGLSYQAYTPMMKGTFSNIPVQVSVPLELP
jgi:uncharacterized membrane protein